MTNSRAGGGLQKLDTHIATGTETTYTYTPGIALDMVNKYREIQIQMTGKATAILGIALKLNANTDYDHTNLFQDNTTISGSLQATISSVHIIASAIMGADYSFAVNTKILFNNASDHLMIQSMGGVPLEGMQATVSEDQSSDTTITSIEILVTTSTWIAGTEITIYGILR